MDKKRPAQRVDSTQVLLSENGSYDFVSDNDAAVPASTLGMLVKPDPVGLMSKPTI